MGGIREEEHFLDSVSAGRSSNKYFCCGCSAMGLRKEITLDEFKSNNGYCDECRDGKNDAAYRAAKDGRRGEGLLKRSGKVF